MNKEKTEKNGYFILAAVILVLNMVIQLSGILPSLFTKGVPFPISWFLLNIAPVLLLIIFLFCFWKKATNLVALPLGIITSVGIFSLVQLLSIRNVGFFAVLMNIISLMVFACILILVLTRNKSKLSGWLILAMVLGTVLTVYNIFAVGWMSINTFLYYAALCVIGGAVFVKGGEEPGNPDKAIKVMGKLFIVIIAAGVVSLFINFSKSCGSGSADFGSCYICGKPASYRLDGQNYCEDDYNMLMNFIDQGLIK